MNNPPTDAKIFHITHVENLSSILAVGQIESDGRRQWHGDGQTSIGMTNIKRRRLYEIEVSCHHGTKVGEYVPFYFCTRSIMLYILHKGNHPDLAYRDGQRPILHLQLDMDTAIRWAEESGVHWAFSDRNAGAFIADFYKNRSALSKIDWESVQATDFREMRVKEGKQAEFLIHDACPWRLVEKIGVFDQEMCERVVDIVDEAEHKPLVDVERTWYY